MGSFILSFAVFLLSLRANTESFTAGTDKMLSFNDSDCVLIWGLNHNKRFDSQAKKVMTRIIESRPVAAPAETESLQQFRPVERGWKDIFDDRQDLPEVKGKQNPPVRTRGPLIL